MTRVRKLLGRGGLYGLVGGFAFFGAFPFYWMIIAMFKRDHDLFSPANNPFLFNEPYTLDHLRLLLFDTHFLQYLANTFLVGLVVVLITLMTAIPAAYSLARWARGWGEMLGIGIFLTYLVPPTILFIPLSRFTSALSLQESLGSLILIYPTFTIPFCTWLLMGFFKTIPRDIEEQAMIRRAEPHGGHGPGGPASGDLRDPHSGGLRLHPLHARVYLCPDFHLRLGQENGLHRRAHGTGAG